jgi:hypothetical protein
LVLVTGARGETGRDEHLGCFSEFLGEELDSLIADLASAGTEIRNRSQGMRKYFLGEHQ